MKSWKRAKEQTKKTNNNYLNLVKSVIDNNYSYSDHADQFYFFDRLPTLLYLSSFHPEERVIGDLLFLCSLVISAWLWLCGFFRALGLPHFDGRRPIEVIFSEEHRNSWSLISGFVFFLKECVVFIEGYLMGRWVFIGWAVWSSLHVGNCVEVGVHIIGFWQIECWSVPPPILGLLPLG